MEPTTHHFGLCDVEDREGILILTMRRSASQDLPADWSSGIIRNCLGPFRGLWIDLGRCPIVSSSFIAGALQLLEHYRNDQLRMVVLTNVSDRIVSLVDIMNLRDLFAIRQHKTPEKKR